MSTPVLHLLAGSNGSGKSTFAEILIARTHLAFVNADLIASERLMAERSSFITETVFSHESKVELVRQAQQCGYTVQLHVMLVPEDLAVQRVADRVEMGGHLVPEEKIRGRYRRLWRLVAQARDLADRVDIYDNSSLERPFRRLAVYEYGQVVGTPDWPAWTPPGLV